MSPAGGAVRPARRPPPPSRAGVPSLLTARGWGLAATAVVAAAAAQLVGIEELYPVAAAAAALLAVSLLWCRARRWGVDVGRQLHPARVEAGRGSTVVLSLRNRSGRTAPGLVLRDPFDGGRRVTELAVAPLGPGQRTTGTYPLAPAGRGVHPVGPLTLETSDPFGLARGVRTSTLTSTLIVHPFVEAVRAPTVGAGTDRTAGAVLAVPGRDNDEFAALREYRPGDDIRRMHWRSTARTDTLMVREDQMERRSQVCILVDVRRSLWSAPSFERALSAAASVACASLDGGFQVRLVTSGGADSAAGSGSAHRDHLLDLLAEAEAVGSRPAGSEPTPTFGAVPLPAGGTVVVVTSERADLDELRRLARLGRAVQLTVVVIERASTASRHPERNWGGAHRVVRVPPTASFAAVWDRAG